MINELIKDHVNPTTIITSDNNGSWAGSWTVANDTVVAEYDVNTSVLTLTLNYRVIYTTLIPADFARTAKAEEEKPDQRPKCGYKVKVEETRKECGSEDGIMNIKGKGKWGRDRNTPVCRKHLDNVVKEWNWESVDPVGDLPTKR